MSGIENVQGEGSAGITGGRGQKIIKNIRPGEIISAGRLLNPVVDKVNQMAARGAFKQIVRRPVPEKRLQIRFSQGVSSDIPTFGRRWCHNRTISFIEGFQHSTAGTFTCQLKVNGTATGPTITQASSNPIDMQATATTDWGDGDYLELDVSAQSGVANFDLIFIVAYS